MAAKTEKNTTSKPTQLNLDDIMSFIAQTGTKDLAELSRAIDEHRTAKRESELSAAKEKIDEILSDVGASILDIYPELRAKRVAGTGSSEVMPKYRNPANANETWSGRGKRPNWLKHVLAQRGIDTDKGAIPMDLHITEHMN